jgi:hypothetical protein
VRKDDPTPAYSPVSDRRRLTHRAQRLQSTNAPNQRTNFQQEELSQVTNHQLSILHCAKSNSTVINKKNRGYGVAEALPGFQAG